MGNHDYNYRSRGAYCLHPVLSLNRAKYNAARKEATSGYHQPERKLLALQNSGPDMILLPLGVLATLALSFSMATFFKALSEAKTLISAGDDPICNWPVALELAKPCIVAINVSDSTDTKTMDPNRFYCCKQLGLKTCLKSSLDVIACNEHRLLDKLFEQNKFSPDDFKHFSSSKRRWNCTARRNTLERCKDLIGPYLLAAETTKKSFDDFKETSDSQPGEADKERTENVNASYASNGLDIKVNFDGSFPVFELSKLWGYIVNTTRHLSSSSLSMPPIYLEEDERISLKNITLEVGVTKRARSGADIGMRRSRKLKTRKPGSYVSPGNERLSSTSEVYVVAATDERSNATDLNSTDLSGIETKPKPEELTTDEHPETGPKDGSTADEIEEMVRNEERDESRETRVDQTTISTSSSTSSPTSVTKDPSKSAGLSLVSSLLWVVISIVLLVKH